jgi:hypothetical protein
LKQQQAQESPPEEIIETPVIQMNGKVNGHTVLKEVILASQQVAERPRSRMRL